MSKRLGVSLREAYPELAEEWHPTLNGDLTPDDVTPGSSLKVFWLLPYDDPVTGMHFDFVWEAVIKNRTKSKTGCPYLSKPAATWKGFNDFETRYPELAKYWHPTKNGDLRPDQVTCGSSTPVWWLFPYDDPETGKHFDFEWRASVYDRIRNKECPFFTTRVKKGFNDLATLCPEIASQWHPTMNGSLTPYQVKPGSNKEVFWLLPYDDPETGKHFEFVWSAQIIKRALYGHGCPFISGGVLYKGFNDLATKRPDLAAQWHPTKNGTLKPEDVYFRSDQDVWWIYPYDDPDSGKHFDFEWHATISNRLWNGTGCPYLTSNAPVWKGFNDLETKCPELVKQWHPVKNGDLRPDQVPYRSMKMVWWLISYRDPRTGKQHDLEWEAKIASRADGTGCPFFSGRVLSGFNDLATLRPDLAQQWHPSLNGTLTPCDVTIGDNARVYWLEPYDDPKTGKHFDFVWNARVADRTTRNRGNPYLSGQKVWKGYNDLESQYPDIALQWDYRKNRGIKPDEVNIGSCALYWWIYPYDDPVTGKHFDFSWQTSVKSRVVNKPDGCPFLTGTGTWPGFNDLQTLRPDVAKLWHPSLNGDLTPSDVRVNSNLRVWWLLPYDDPKTGKHFDFVWENIIENQVNSETGCPYLANSAVWSGYNDLQSQRSDIAKQWHPAKNGDLTPDKVLVSSTMDAWWIYPYDDLRTGKHFDFEWHSPVKSRVVAVNDCPYLANNAVWPGYNDLLSQRPDIAKQWHPTKNGDLTPDKVLVTSGDWVWWLFPYDDPRTGEHFDFEWAAQIGARVRNDGRCPFITGSRVWAGFNDLGSRCPEIAAEWHPTRNRRKTPEKTNWSTNRKVWWKCSAGHEWYASVSGRTLRGAGCPECAKEKRRYGIWDN